MTFTNVLTQDIQQTDLSLYIAAHCEVYSIQHYVIKFVSALQQVGGFLLVLWFHLPIKLTATI